MSFDIYKEEKDFLKQRGLLKEGFESFIIKGDFGEVDLVKLLDEYAEIYYEKHYPGEYGRADY